ncbi:hypothetical protein O3301_04215 [Janthinobacterium sp. SUN211]|uniref:hypothetical protein n=1 Tax=Janthinobacterium sp. SUN211 TaxID=3014786 RepID=UPI00271309B1|nr:hypothetical protein [Janthinobacterium sp. SUN211]MDO8047661.1 hypothetical protein [Janthinobacterium sp. SUN211]
MSGIPARPCKPARAEWIRFAPADDASCHAAMMANMRPVLWRSVLLGGCVLILAFIVQAVWRDVPYAGEAVLLGLPALTAWIVGVLFLPGPDLSFHVEINDAGVLLSRLARGLPGHDKVLQLTPQQMRALEVVTYAGAVDVYRGGPPMARVELLLHTTLDDCPLIRVVGMDLPVPQRWSLRQIKDELGRRCTLAGIPVTERAGATYQASSAIRALWPPA